MCVRAGEIARGLEKFELCSTDTAGTLQVRLCEAINFFGGRDAHLTSVCTIECLLVI